MTGRDARIDRPIPNRPLTGSLARARRRDAKAIAEFKRLCKPGKHEPVIHQGARLCGKCGESMEFDR